MMQKLFALACLPLVSVAGECKKKTKAEVLEGIRTENKCTNAEPTTCACLGNAAKAKYPSGILKDCADSGLLFDATTAGAVHTDCVDITPDVDKDWNKHTVQYPATYALTCDAMSEAGSGTGFEPGSYDCTKVTGKEMTHEFKFDSENFNNDYDSELWCADKFCWVDPCNCNKADIATSSWIPGMYYSYEVCGGPDRYSTRACDKDTKKGCDAITSGGFSTCKWVESENNSSDADGAPGVAAWLAGPAVIAVAFLQL